MADVEMKDAAAAAKASGEDEKNSSPKGIRLEDILRNVDLIVKAVERNQTRLTTRAISRCGRHRTAVGSQ